MEINANAVLIAATIHRQVFFLFYLFYTRVGCSLSFLIEASVQLAVKE